MKPRSACALCLVLLSGLATAAQAAAPASDPAASPTAAKDDYKTLTFDAGGASSFSNGASAFEGHIGINYFLTRWLAWRNSPFFRAQSGADSSFGLDTSLDGSYAVKVDDGIEPYGKLGAGYRLTNLSGGSAPFAEIGAGSQIHGIGLGITVKEVLHSVVHAGAANETIYSFNFSGGMSL